jgi:hypothetical protein
LSVSCSVKLSSRFQIATAGCDLGSHGLMGILS